MGGEVEASGPTAASELFGRDGELGLIEAFIAGTATGGGALLLFGEPGVGKTVLLDAAATRAQRLGCAQYVRRGWSSRLTCRGLGRASAAVLGFVARRLPGSRVGLLAATRTAQGGFLESAGLPELELQPLDEDAAGGLLSARFPALAADVHQRVLAEAQGNL
jgi:hypothetical protein